MNARAGRREWLGLAVLALPLLLVSTDVSVLYFAVPSISRDLHASATQQLWIFDVYGFVLAGLLLTMGAVGDRIGRRRLLLIGAAAFGAASLGAAYAPDPELLIAARAVLGIGGATLMPSTLGLVRAMFADERDRARAIGVWSAVSVGGVAVGPVLSGVLIEHFWWGSVFLVNVPVMVLLLVLGPRLLPEHRVAAAGRFDLPGAALSLLAVLPAVFAVKRWATDGFGPLVVGAAVVGAVAAIAFVRRQRTAAHPLLDLELLRAPRVAAGVVASAATMFVLAGCAVFLTQWLQLVAGFSPLVAALWSLAPSVVIACVAPVGQVLGKRYGARPVVVSGLVVAAAGAGLVTQVHAGSSVWVLLAAATVLNGGLVVVTSLATEVVVGGVDTDRAGTASATLETGNELGGALGIALLGSVGAAAYRGWLSHRGVGGAPLHDGLSAAVGTPAADLARQAFCHGFGVVGVAAAGLLVALAAISWRGLRTRPAEPAGDQPASSARVASTSSASSSTR